MKRKGSIYMLAAVLLLVFTLNPIAYANSDDRIDDRDRRDDRTEIRDVLEPLILFAALVNLLDNNRDRYHTYYSDRTYYYKDRHPVRDLRIRRDSSWFKRDRDRFDRHDGPGDRRDRDDRRDHDGRSRPEGPARPHR